MPKSFPRNHHDLTFQHLAVSPVPPYRTGTIASRQPTFVGVKRQELLSHSHQHGNLPSNIFKELSNNELSNKMIGDTFIRSLLVMS